MSERPVTSWSRVALGCVGVLGLGLGLWLRTKPLAGAFLFGDELHTLPSLGLDARTLAGRYDAVGSGLALPLIQKATVGAFGASLPALRAVAWLPSLVLVGLVALLARREGSRVAAWVASLLLATGSLFIFYGHFARGYSLAAALCLGALLLCARALDEADSATGSSSAGRGWTTVVLIGLCGGLACWAHLTSVFFLLGVGVGVLARSVPGKRVVRSWASAPPLQGLAVAALLGALVHLPALDSLMAFVGHKGEQVYSGSFGPFDVLRVLAGSNPGAWALLVGLPVAAASDGMARGRRSLLLISATFVPPVILALASPFGDAYAYARYLLPSAASGAVLIALASARMGAALEARWPSLPAMFPGLLLAVFLLVAGPKGPWAPSLGPFVNTYLSLYPLPAFTDGVPPAPAVYADLAADSTSRLIILETPPMPNRSVHYLAALARWHGHDVRVGTFGPLLSGAPDLESDLYVDLSRPELLDDRFDRLVVHRDLMAEVDRYWAAVYDDAHDGPERAFMARHRQYGRSVPGVSNRVIEQLTNVLGTPAHADLQVVIWSREAANAPSQ